MASEKTQSTNLYTVERNVECLNCGNRGAIKIYGKYYPNGYPKDDGDLTEELTNYVRFCTEPTTHGLNCTIPHVCMNCSNVGLIDSEDINGFKQAFRKKTPSLLDQ